MDMLATCPKFSVGPSQRSCVSTQRIATCIRINFVDLVQMLSLPLMLFNVLWLFVAACVFRMLYE